jgi:regulatory protein
LCFLGYWIVNIQSARSGTLAIKSDDHTQEQRACQWINHKIGCQVETVQLGVGSGQGEFVAFGTYNRSKGREKRLREPLDAAALYEYAVRSLGSKMRTVAELKRLMRRRVEPEETGEAKMEAVVLRLKELHYLDDTRYASDYTRMRVENEKFGRRRVQQDLIQRGIHEQVIGKTLDATYSELPEAELARKYIERKRLRKPTNEKETARIVRSLVRAGFSMGTIFPLLKAWQVEESTLQAVVEIDLDTPESGA